jgi:hypothetical protein
MKEPNEKQRYHDPKEYCIWVGLQPFSGGGEDRVGLQPFSNGGKDGVGLPSRHIALVIARKMKKAGESWAS